MTMKKVSKPRRDLKTGKKVRLQAKKCSCCNSPVNCLESHVYYDSDTRELRGILCFKCHKIMSIHGGDAIKIRKVIQYALDHIAK